MLQALIKNPPEVTGPGQVSVFVQFYDDTEPANSKLPTLFVEEVSLPFVSSATGDDIKAIIIARGQQIQTTLTKLEQIKSVISAPTTIAIG